MAAAELSSTNGRGACGPVRILSLGSAPPPTPVRWRLGRGRGKSGFAPEFNQSVDFSDELGRFTATTLHSEAQSQGPSTKWNRTLDPLHMLRQIEKVALEPPSREFEVIGVAFVASDVFRGALTNAHDVDVIQGRGAVLVDLDVAVAGSRGEFFPLLSGPRDASHFPKGIIHAAETGLLNDARKILADVGFVALLVLGGGRESVAKFGELKPDQFALKFLVGGTFIPLVPGLENRRGKLVIGAPGSGYRDELQELILRQDELAGESAAAGNGLDLPFEIEEFPEVLKVLPQVPARGDSAVLKDMKIVEAEGRRKPHDDDQEFGGSRSSTQSFTIDMGFHLVSSETNPVIIWRGWVGKWLLEFLWWLRSRIELTVGTMAVFRYLLAFALIGLAGCETLPPRTDAVDERRNETLIDHYFEFNGLERHPLRPGMSRNEIVSIVGPPTKAGTNGRETWYHNPQNIHVAPMITIWFEDGMARVVTGGKG
jgi:hypothetical protein